VTMPADALVALEQEQAVRRALAALGERCREILHALYFEEFRPGSVAYAEIAGRLGIARGSVGPTRQRCLEGMRRELVALGFGEDAGIDVSAEGRAASSPARDATRPHRERL